MPLERFAHKMEKESGSMLFESMRRGGVAALIALIASVFALAVAPARAALPELPRAYVDTTLVASTGQTIAVAAGGNVQAAIDAARPGDVITLEAGATFTGNFTLPAKSG